MITSWVNEFRNRPQCRHYSKSEIVVCCVTGYGKCRMQLQSWARGRSALLTEDVRGFLCTIFFLFYFSCKPEIVKHWPTAVRLIRKRTWPLMYLFLKYFVILYLGF